jgi:hypothetical protein
MGVVIPCGGTTGCGRADGIGQIKVMHDPDWKAGLR